MGIIRHKDLFSSKYNTAIIVDSNNRAKFVAIKSVIDDCFFAKFQGMMYCFRIVPNRLITYRETAAKTCQFLVYTTDNYMPLSPSDTTRLEELLTKNHVTKVNRNMLKTFQILGSRETPENQEHDIDALINEITQYEDRFPDDVHNLRIFLKDLGEGKKIIGPVKKTSEFLTDELLVTDARFMGSIDTLSNMTDKEHKQVTNTPITPKKDWMKWAAILMIVGLVAGLAYYGYSSGAFGHMGGSLFPTNAPSSSDIMKQYPDPSQLKKDVASGKVDYKSLPPDVQKMVDNTKLP